MFNSNHHKYPIDQWPNIPVQLNVDWEGGRNREEAQLTKHTQPQNLNTSSGEKASFPQQSHRHFFDKVKTLDRK